MHTKERLARALEEHADRTGDIRISDMVGRARDGYYDDLASPLDSPIAHLIHDAETVGLHELAHRARQGEFDATADEAKAWTTSREGQALFAEVFGARDAPRAQKLFGGLLDDPTAAAPPQGTNRAARRGNRNQGRRRRRRK